jgi:predicted acyl esterase
MPIDQRSDDGLALTFTSAPVEEPVEILGFPEVHLALSVDQPNALIAVRLCDIFPDGASRLVSWGLLNLTHRNSHENPEPLEPGQVYSITIRLNVVAHRLLPGHRWRISLSPTYWPHAWPSPVPVQVTVYTGEESRLVLPVRLAGILDESLAPFQPPEGAAPLEFEDLRSEESTRTITYEVTTAR